MKEDVFIFKSNNVTVYVRPQELFGGEANVFFGFPGKGEYRQSLVKTFNISRKLISF